MKLTKPTAQSCFLLRDELRALTRLRNLPTPSRDVSASVPKI